MIRIRKAVTLFFLELIASRCGRAEVDDEDNTDFEDFLNFLSTVVPPEGMTVLGQEMVIRHAEFLVNQVSIILPSIFSL